MAFSGGFFNYSFHLIFRHHPDDVGPSSAIPLITPFWTAVGQKTQAQIKSSVLKIRAFWVSKRARQQSTLVIGYIF
jgi:hypothetical protein